jgi:branched-chain amino acid transport system substrate-binding protein
MTFGPDPRPNPAATLVVKTFEAKGVNPEAYTLYSYAALQVIAMSATFAKSLDPKQVAAATRSGNAGPYEVWPERGSTIDPCAFPEIAR